MATELGKAYIQIVPSAKGISGSISNAMEPEGAKAGKAAGESIVGKIKGVIIAAGIGKMLGNALNEGGKLQQSLGGVETLYKKSAGKMKQYAADAYKTASMSANDYMELSTSFAAGLISSTAGDTDKAADIANTAIIDMSDNANKMGTSMESIQNAYQGFAKQNYTMLDNLKLGYGGTKTEMERLLKDATKLTGVKYDINNLSDVYNAIHAVQGKLGITGTTAKESAETFQGSMASMQSAFKNLMGQITLGQDIGPSLNALAQTVATFLFKNLIPMVLNVVKSLPGAIIGFIQAAGPEFYKAAQDLLSNFTNSFGEGSGEILQKFSLIISDLIYAVRDFLPGFIESGFNIISNIVIGFLEGVPNLLLEFGYIFYDLIAMIGEILPEIAISGGNLVNGLITGLKTNLPLFVESAKSMISTMIVAIEEYLPVFIREGLSMIGSMASGIGEAVPLILTAIGDILSHLIDSIIEFGPSIFESASSAMTNFASGITGNVPGISTAMSEILGKILDLVTEKGPQLIGKGIEIVSKLAKGVLDNIPAISNSIKIILDKLISKIIEKGPTVISKGFELIGKLARGILDNLPEAGRAIGSVLTNIIQLIIKHGPNIIKEGFNLILKLGKGILENLPYAISTIGSVIANLLKEISKNIPQFLASGLKLLGELGIGIVKAIPGLVSKIPSVIGAILKSFGSIFGEMAKIGGQLISGLWKGISGATGWIADKVKGFASNLVGGVKKFFNIASPSKLFRNEIGAMLGKGLGLGIMDEVGFVSKAMDQLENEATRDMTNTATMKLKTDVDNGILSKTGELYNQGKEKIKQPATVVLNLGSKAYRAFVEDITNTQESTVNLHLSYEGV